MSILFFSDPHIGLLRSANTTLASRQRLRRQLARRALEAANLADGEDDVVCLGDLFDRYTNEESIVLEGAEVARRCALVLAGNHDVANRADTSGSLELLRHVNPDLPIAYTPPGLAGTELATLWGVKAVAIPHVISQDLFERSVAEACKQGGDMLLLHCNVMNGLADGHEISLNLTEDLAEAALKVFDYVLTGHEHLPRTLFDDRLIVLGNTMPLSFGEVGERFVWTFDGSGFDRESFWDPATRFLNLSVAQVMDAPSLGEGVEMVDVSGEVRREESADFAAAMASLWKRHEGLLMVRNGATFESAEFIQAETESVLVRLPDAIRASISDIAMRSLYDTYLQRLEVS